MQHAEAISIVVKAVEKVAPGAGAVGSETVLLGAGGVLESMSLVELCLELEDVANSLDFEFDWTSDSAMSRNRSMFQTIDSLASDLAAQAAARNP